MTVVTPLVRSSLKRTAFWSVGTVVALIIAAVVLLGRGVAVSDGVFLSAENAAPGGGMAVAEVLADQGVEVHIVATLREARSALEGADATLLLHDQGGYLESDQVNDISQQAAHTVLIEPGLLQLRDVTPQVGAAGAVEGELTRDCSIGAVARADTVLGDGSGYRLATDAENAKSCLGSGDDTYSLIQFEYDDRKVTVLGTSAALSNEHVGSLGNAALALGVLGQHPTLVWYQPTIADVTGTNATIADLTPAWLSPVLALMFLVVIAAGVWKGRRMGPLVVEHLPVTVPANETVDGRARLYQKASARLRTLDALRVGTISRLAATCGLARTASVADVAAMVASITSRNLQEVRWLLLEAEPTTDRELIRLSDELLTLEKTTTAHATGQQPHH